MLEHPILQRRREIYFVKEDLKQARFHFKNAFIAVPNILGNRCKNKTPLKITRSQQADINHLIEVAQKNLQLAKAVQEKVEQQGPKLVEIMEESDKALQRAQETLHEIRVFLEKKIASIKHEQRALNKKFEQGEIVESELEQLEIGIEEKMHALQKAYETFETIESDLEFLMTKIRCVLDAGQFEQFDALQTHLALITAATKYITAEPLLEEKHAIVKRVFESVERLRGNEVVETDFESLRQSVSQSHHYPQGGLVTFWTPASNHEIQGSTPHFALPASVQ